MQTWAPDQRRITPLRYVLQRIRGTHFMITASDRFHHQNALSRRGGAAQSGVFDRVRSTP
jgi:hypothetical protein